MPATISLHQFAFESAVDLIMRERLFFAGITIMKTVGGGGEVKDWRATIQAQRPKWYDITYVGVNISFRSVHHDSPTLILP